MRKQIYDGRKIRFAALLGVLLPTLGLAQDIDAIEITTIPVRDGIYVMQGEGGNDGVSIGDDGPSS
jgi:hypothetical protein